MAAKRKYPSGAQKRKARALKAKERDGQLYALGSMWTSIGSSLSSVRAGSQALDPSQPATELPIYGIPPSYIVQIVNAAITQLEQGMFYQAAYLADGMTRDDRLAATLGVRTMAITGARLDLEPSDDSKKAEEVKDECARLLQRMLPGYQVGALLRNGLLMSVGIAQVITQRSEKETLPTIRVWNNRNLRYDWNIRKYCLVTENRGEIVLEPDDPEWVIFEPYGPHGWLNGALMRSVATSWLIRHWTREWWARHAERHGSAIIAGIIPASRNTSDEKTFLSQLKKLAHEAVIRLPQGIDGNKFDVKLVEAQANTWQGFKELLTHCDDSLAIAILGQQQSTKGQGGLGTQENAGEDTLLKLSRTDALIYELLRDKVLEQWADDNYGAREIAPHVCPQIEPPEDLEGRASHLDKLADAVSKFALAPDFARHVDIRALLESFNVPLRPENEVPEDEADDEGKAQRGAEMMQKVKQAQQDVSDDSNQKDPADK